MTGAATGLHIRELDDTTRAAWDRFVDTCPDATFCHRAGWKPVIERSFGHKTHFLYAEADGVIQGVLPLVRIKSPLFGHRLVSNAFCVYGGPAAVSDAAREALDRAALDLTARYDVDYLEYRTMHPPARDDGWVTQSDVYATFRKPLYPDPERNMLAVPSKQRNTIRKGMKSGAKAVVEPDAARFYEVFAENMRDLGTPVFGRNYFENLTREFGDACEILLVTKDDRPVCGAMLFFFRNEVTPYYVGSRKGARELSAISFMYWEALNRAAARGCEVFDFSRSKRGTGSFDLKRHWGFVPEPLHYRYKLHRKSELPNLNPLNRKYRQFIAIWKRLPLPVANLFGPMIIRDLG